MIINNLSLFIYVLPNNSLSLYLLLTSYNIELFELNKMIALFVFLLVLECLLSLKN